MHPVTRQEDDDDEVLFQGDDFQITQEDVDKANEEGRKRMGEEFHQLLTAREATPEEIDAMDELNPEGEET